MTSSTVSIEIRGIEQAISNLKTLEYNARRRSVSAAVRSANAVIVQAAKAAAPRRTGALADSIRGSAKLDRSTGTVIGTITFKSTKAQKKKGRDAYYAHMVIGGTKPHVIPGVRKRRQPGGKSVRQYAVIGGRPYSRVQHPGIKGNPFMERVADVHAAAAVEAFQTRFSEAIETEVAKLSVT